MASTGRIAVAAENQAQLDAWDGSEGAYWTEHADRFDRSVNEHHRRLLDAAAVAADDRVLDLGCGTGQTTRDAARLAVSGSAVGIDLSSRMLALARERAEAEQLANATFVHGDAQVHPFDRESFDLAISRTGAMFFADPVAAFTNVARALAPGGRLVLVAWQGIAGNEWLREISGALAAGRERPTPPSDAPGPFALSEPDRVRSILAGSGFRDVALDGYEAPMWFGSDADEAHAFVMGTVGWMVEGLDDADRSRALDDLRAVLAAHATPDGVLLGSAAWVITAARG